MNNNNVLAGMGVFTILALAIFIFVICPVFTIMALNTLFGIGIPLTIWTWFSAFWLTLIFAPLKKFKN